jgi:hypothetical protein
MLVRKSVEEMPVQGIGKHGKTIVNWLLKEWNLKGIECEDVHWIHVTQDRECCCEHGHNLKFFKRLEIS